MKKSKSPDQATNEAAALAAQPEATQPEAPQQAAVAPQGTQVAPTKAAAKTEVSQKKNAPRAKQDAKKATSKKQAKEAGKKVAKPKEAPVARERSKKDIILDLLRRPKGATLAELMQSTGWKAHTIRGLVSILGSKHRMKINSTKREDGARLYSIAR